ncbi:hypothetical protein DFH08DRAFT_1073615 [Mycena albidolilacea]|uniref:Uncharacterized protein n=1 Tax=Mycena albidolilacea TaxID=1033008 RepID=A0AAD7AMA0_9AGAR|nr:hypothetical protein DFH08DRAFT_1073615 [Mycena albidolilacea]
MSRKGQTIFNDSNVRYVFIAALSIIVFVGLMLFWCSRVVEDRMRLLRPAILLSTHADPERKLPPRPRLYDGYLDWGAGTGAGAGAGGVARGHASICAPIPTRTTRRTSPPTLKHDPDPDFGAALLPSAAAPLTLAVLIAMPVPVPTPLPLNRGRTTGKKKTTGPSPSAGINPCHTFYFGQVIAVNPLPCI